MYRTVKVGLGHPSRFAYSLLVKQTKRDDPVRLLQNLIYFIMDYVHINVFKNKYYTFSALRLNNIIHFEWIHIHKKKVFSARLIHIKGQGFFHMTTCFLSFSWSHKIDSEVKKI